MCTANHLSAVRKNLCLYLKDLLVGSNGNNDSEVLGMLLK